MAKPSGFLCGPRIYEYKDVTFEIPGIGGPCPLKKNGDPKEYVGRDFYKLMDEFYALPENEQEEHRIGGGCIQF
jgi:hypothetical protein